MSERIVGVVKWFNSAKGFGFIGHDGGQDVFVHYSAIRTDGYKELAEHERVEFSIEPAKQQGKFQAADVVKLEGK